MKKVAIITFYDEICIGPRLLSVIAKNNGIAPHLIIFKGQKTRPIFRDSKDHATYQFYIDGIKYGSCYAAYPYTQNEISLLVDLVKKIDPSLICLSTRSFGLSVAREIVKNFKINNIGATIISGGWGPTLEPEKFLEFCDYVCFGEGEKPFEEICRQLNDGENCNFSDISNLIYYENGKIKKNTVIPPVNNEELNRLAFPDFDFENKYLIDKNSVKTSGEFYNNRMFNCFAGRGCPLSCTYCMSGRYRSLYSAYGYSIKKFRVRDLATVIEELVAGKQQGAKFIRMNDEVFPTDKAWIKQFLKLYKEKIDLPFFAYVRPEFHSPELIKEMASTGLSSTIVGIQAGSEYIRKSIFKRMFPTEKLVRFAETINRLGIDYSYHLINHNPFETEKDMEETLDLLYQIPYASLFIFKLVPLRGTPIYRLIEESNVVSLPSNTHKWYGHLYTMAVKGPVFRAACKVIHKYRLFNSSLFVFPVIFFPTFIKLHLKKLMRKILFGSYTLMPIPVKFKNDK